MGIVYLNGHFLPAEKAHISPMDRGFLFGDAVYEVIRAYRGRLFRLDAHFGRLADSLAKMRMGAYLTPLKDVPARLLEENGLADRDALVYLQVTRGSSPARQHAFPPPETKATIFGFAWEYQANRAWYDPGMTVLLVPDDRWARCDIKVSALVPNVLANQRAREAGAHEAVFVRDGVVLEGTHSNFFAVLDGEVRTAPLSNYILPGITRAALLELCSAHDIPLRETPVFEHELEVADELFLTATTVDVAPIYKLNGRVLPSSRPVTGKLQRLFAELVERESA
jgi:D-alanine transaminase